MYYCYVELNEEMEFKKKSMQSTQKKYVIRKTAA